MTTKPYKINGLVTSRLYHNDYGIEFSPPCKPGKVKKVSWAKMQDILMLAEMFNAIFEHYEDIARAETFEDVAIFIDGKEDNLRTWVEIINRHGALDIVGPPDEIDERVTLRDWKDDPAPQCTSILTYAGA